MNQSPNPKLEQIETGCCTVNRTTPTVVTPNTRAYPNAFNQTMNQYGTQNAPIPQLPAIPAGQNVPMPVGELYPQLDENTYYENQPRTYYGYPPQNNGTSRLY